VGRAEMSLGRDEGWCHAIQVLEVGVGRVTTSWTSGMN
jgi:hypothetical protein